MTFAARRVAVCSGCRFRRKAMVDRVLNAEHIQQPIGLMMAGDGTLADGWALDWAESRGIACRGFAAVRGGEFWKEIMNDRLMREGQPEMLIVFPGSGTFDMINRAWLARIPVHRAHYSSWDMLCIVTGWIWPHCLLHRAGKAIISAIENELAARKL